MLTSFFKKSTPMNYLIVGLILVGGYVYAQRPLSEMFSSWKDGALHLVFTAVVVFSMLLLGFVVRKNSLTRRNTYAIFIFAFFTLMIPGVFRNANVLVASLFSLLSLRRVFSFTSNKNIEKKVLDATLWLWLAGLFYFYCLLFLIPLFVALLKKKQLKPRLLLIPVLGLIAGLALTSVFFFLVEDSFDWFFRLIPEFSLDFSAYSDFHLLIPVTLFVSLSFWVGFYRLFRVSSLMRKERPNYIILLVVMLSGLAMAFMSPLRDGSELFFVVPSLSVAMTDYLENRETRFITETFLWAMVLIPIGMALL